MLHKLLCRLGIHVWMYATCDFTSWKECKCCGVERDRHTPTKWTHAEVKETSLPEV
jgi:hypothetical protein